MLNTWTVSVFFLYVHLGSLLLKLTIPVFRPIIVFIDSLVFCPPMHPTPWWSACRILAQSLTGWWSACRILAQSLTPCWYACHIIAQNPTPWWSACHIIAQSLTPWWYACHILAQNPTPWWSACRILAQNPTPWWSAVFSRRVWLRGGLHTSESS